MWTGLRCGAVRCGVMCCGAGRRGAARRGTLLTHWIKFVTGFQYVSWLAHPKKMELTWSVVTQTPVSTSLPSLPLHPPPPPPLHPSSLPSSSSYSTPPLPPSFFSYGNTLNWDELARPRCIFINFVPLLCVHVRFNINSACVFYCDSVGGITMPTLSYVTPLNLEAAGDDKEEDTCTKESNHFTKHCIHFNKQ